MSSSRISSFVAAYVRLLGKYKALVFLASLLCALVSGYLASSLSLKTDFALLLPDGDASVVELRRVQAALPSLQALIVNVRGPNAQANERFVDDLLSALDKLPKEQTGLVYGHFKDEFAWLDSRMGYYVSLPELKQVVDKLRAALKQAANPLALDLGLDDDVEDDAAAEQLSLQQQLERIQQEKSRLLGADIKKQFPGGYFATPDRSSYMVVLVPPGGLFQENAGAQLQAQVKELVAQLGPEGYGVAEVGYSGEIASLLLEREALEDDLVWATSICTLLVALVVYACFGRWRYLPLVVVPTLLGALVAYAAAACDFGYLNASTAFLASIIVGNGINFGIIQLARYLEERRQGASAFEANVAALLHTVPATAMAAVSAAVAYGSLIVTQFRGFSQFGLMGGVGMLATYVFTITLLPSLLLWLDEGVPGGALGDKDLSLFRQLFNRVAHWISLGIVRVFAYPRAIMALALVSVLASCLLIGVFLRDPFEYNFHRLRSARNASTLSGEARYRQDNEDVFGHILNPLVTLAPSGAQVPSILAAVAAADANAPGGPILQHSVAITSLLPKAADPEDWAQRQPLLQDLVDLLSPSSLANLPRSQRLALAAYRPPAALAPLVPSDLPAVLRLFFEEQNGDSSRTVLSFVDAARYEPWSGQDMLKLAARIEELHLPDGTAVRSVGSAIIFSGMLRSMLRDGPIASALSALSVGVIVLLMRVRVWQRLMLVAALLLGVAWMLGLGTVFGMKLNFLNFVAIPITFGIGIDYAINMMQRLREDSDWKRAVLTTGGAVTLCSLTTIIGYAALLVADNLALRSFGSLAILGELTCLIAALGVLPVFYAWWAKRL